MTKTEWNKAKRALEQRGEYVARDGLTIRKHQGRYGFEYHVYAPGTGCIAVEYDLQHIAEWLVD